MQVFIINQDGSKTPVALKPASPESAPFIKVLRMFSLFKSTEEKILQEVINKMADVDSADERLEAEAELERRIKFIATMMKDELEKRDLWQYMWPEDAEYVEDRIHANYEFRW